MTRTIAALAAALTVACTTWRATILDLQPGAFAPGDAEYLVVTDDLALELALTRADDRTITGTIVAAWRVPPRVLAATSDEAGYLVDTDDDPAALAAHLGWTPIAGRDGLTVTVARADVRYARRAETSVPRGARIALGIALGAGLLVLLGIGFADALMSAIPG